MPNARPKILCTWEIGADLGHVSRLAGLAQILLQRGFNVTVALKDLSRCQPFFAGLDVHLLQAPVWLPRISMQRPIACLPDTLLLNGYLEVDPLLALVRAWRGLIDLVKPDLLIGDYSPTALLAVHGSTLPRILVGTGFAEPIPGQPVADWRPFATTDELIPRQEQRVLQTINAVLKQGNQPEVAYLGDLFHADTTFITTYPEFDLYQQQRRNAIYCITRNDQAFGPAMPWPKVENAGAPAPDTTAPRILAYLKPQYPQLPQLLDALSRCHASRIVACPGGDANLLQRHNTAGMICSRELVDLEAALETADLFVGHGNMASTTQALRAGKPVIVLPVHLEQLLTGKVVQQQQLGTLMEKIESVDTLKKLLEASTRDSGLQQRTSAYAHRHATLAITSVSVLMADRCESLLRS